MKFDVAIIGAGVIGALTARELTRYRLRVLLLEKSDDVAGGASRANSGIVHGGFDPAPGSRKAFFNRRGTEKMQALAEELGVSYRNNGSMVLAFSDEEARSVRELYERGLRNGIPGLSLIGKEEILRLEPHVSPDVTVALRCTSSGIVCPYGLTIAAAGNAMDNGAELWCNFAVDAITPCEQGFRISSGDRSVEADFVVNCAGIHADRIAAMIGDTEYRILPRKGEYLLLDRAEGNLCSHTLFQVPTKAGKGVLVTPTADGNLLIGPTSVPQPDKDCRDTTADGMAAIRTAAEKTMKNIPYRQIITSFTGLRASLVGQEDFVLTPSSHFPRFLHAIGIDSPGLSSAPAIAEELVRLLREAGLPCIPNPDFCGCRASYHVFAGCNDEEKNAIIRKNHAYGHIVCRCESITEGEILDAIRRNPPARSIDAVKRRVRAGMGRCQGGFCTTYVTDLLAREGHISPLQVTKCGPGSELLTGWSKQEDAQ